MNTTTTATESTTFTLDPMHTTVSFGVRHLMITTVRGAFRQVKGTLRYDRARPGDAELRVEIAAASVDTREEARDAHLRSADFFDAERHPRIAFHSTAIRLDRGRPVEVTGTLSLRGTTRDVTLAVTEVTGEQKDHNGRVRVGASATATIKRSDFGMTYNKVLEAGGVAVSDAVSLTLDVSFVKD
jgi:polyisoprenoid-binding protein YceI